MQVTQVGTIQLAITTTPATPLDHVTYYKQQDDGHFEMVAELTDSLAYDWKVDASQNGLVRWVALVSSPAGGVGVTPMVTVEVDIQAATGPTHPSMFINQQEIDAVKARISAGSGALDERLQSNDQRGQCGSVEIAGERRGQWRRLC